ncbi:MAG: FAD-dependent monooxygenase [Pseudomonadota bacterium]
MIETDVFIAGGGIAGLLAALTFGADGKNVTCADPKAIVDDSEDPLADQRTTAYLQPAQTLMEELDLWDVIAPWAMGLQVMRLADAGGDDGALREVVDFDAAEISDLPFGWNIANWRMRRTLASAISARPNITFLSGVYVKSVLTRSTEARITLSDGLQITTPLLIGADGRDSFVREAVGINAKTTRYGQKALVFTVTHSERHQNISTEIHQSGGPFTLVPLPDFEGRPASSVVWMDFASECTRRMSLSRQDFAAEATGRSGHALGALELVSDRQVWPIITREASHLKAERTALMAEAAHVIPPIGAQGLNMSVADILALREAAHAHTLGSASMLTQYASARAADIAFRIRGIDALNRAAMTRSPNLQALRLKGLQTLHGVKPIRRMAMQTGLGAQT